MGVRVRVRVRVPAEIRVRSSARVRRTTPLTMRGARLESVDIDETDHDALRREARTVPG